jgi:RimJ/RimL family protein N-acetyltransferase
VDAIEGCPPLAAPMPDVETDRLVLRRFAPDDLDRLAEVFAAPEVWRFPYGRGFTRDETATFLDAQIAQWDACGVGCWVAIERARDAVVGYVGLSVPTFLPEILPALEVGWRLHPDVWGRGYATEGASAALDQAFTTLGLDGVCSIPQTDNPASVRVAERLGMWREKTMRLPATDRRGAVDAEIYRITREEWLSRRP